MDILLYLQMPRWSGLSDHQSSKIAGKLGIFLCLGLSGLSSLSGLLILPDLLS